MQPPIAQVLLQHFRWNEERLLEQYMESDQSVLRAVGEPQNVQPGPVDDYDGSPPASKRARLNPRAEGEQFDCPICCSSVSVKDETFTLRCSHRFCTDCWKDYVTAQVKDEGQCFFKCMQDGCSTTVDSASIERVVPDSVFKRYVHYCAPSDTE